MENGVLQMHVIFSFFILVPYVHLNVFYEYGPWVRIPHHLTPVDRGQTNDHS